jgi:hypothetical protein
MIGAVMYFGVVPLPGDLLSPYSLYLMVFLAGNDKITSGLGGLAWIETILPNLS